MGYRILLIDHGSGAATRLGEALAGAGHATLGVAGVVEALLMIESRPLDAVLIDEGGAEEALIALCARVASLGREKRSAVIVLADHVSRMVGDPFERARRIGCDRVVDSAISGDELLALLGALVGPPPQRTEAIEDTNRDAPSAESFGAGFDAPLLEPADDRGGDIEAHLDSLFAGSRPGQAAPSRPPASRPAAPARSAAPRSSVSTEPGLPRVDVAVAAPPAPARETARRPPKALEQLRQPRVAVAPVAAPVRRWPTVPPRAAATAAIVLAVAGGIAGFAWLRPERSATAPPPPPRPTAQAAARVQPQPAPAVAADEPPSPSPGLTTEEAKLPVPPTLEEQPSTIDFAAPAIPMGPAVAHSAPEPAAAAPPSPKPKGAAAAAAKATAKPTPPPKTTTAPAAVAEAPKPAPAPAPPAPAAPAPPEPRPTAVAAAEPGPPPAPEPAAEAPAVPPAILERIEPTYSPQALKKADGAVIVLRVLVDEQGRISRVVVDQGLPGSELESAAISAVLRWRFQPATEGGAPVAAWTSARFEFKR